MSFHHQEKIKRIKISKELAKKGLKPEEIAQYFGVQKETVMEYLVAGGESHTSSQLIIAKDKKIPTLFSYAQKTVSSSSFFKDVPYVEGFQCPLCRRYRKYEVGKKWDSKRYICFECFMTLTPEKKAILDKKDNFK